MRTSILRAVDLSKRWADGTLALDALNIDIAAGEIYCLLGARGAGKTTAVRLLLGLIEPTAGRIERAGHAAFLPADFAFYDALTARENARCFAGMGDRVEPTLEQVDRALREVGLPEATFDRRVAGLSLGHRQKLGVAVALLENAPAWVLDEPLSGLDPQAAAEVVELLAAAAVERKAAVLWATQDLFRAKELADRVCILKEGRQVLTFSRAELETQDLERLYLDYMRGGG